MAVLEANNAAATAADGCIRCRHSDGQQVWSGSGRHHVEGTGQTEDQLADSDLVLQPLNATIAASSAIQTGNGIVDNNNSNDINSFRVRRVETKLVYEFNEMFGSTMMFDPAREAATDSQASRLRTGQLQEGWRLAMVSSPPVPATTVTGGLISGNNGAASGWHSASFVARRLCHHEECGSIR